MTIEETNQPKKKQTWLIAAGAILLVALVGGAAFIGGRLVRQPAPNVPGQSGMSVHIASGGAGGDAVEMSVQFLPAEELPKTPPDANGLFVERQDNRLIIGTGNVQVMVSGEQGEASTSADYDGPKVEVVVTQATRIYRDATAPDFESGSTTIQQKVEEGDLDEIGSQSVVTVWGKKNGDRVVAEVLVYMNPVMIRAPGVK